MDHAATVWEVSERTFFAGPMASPLRLLRRMRVAPRPAGHRSASGSLHRRAPGDVRRPPPRAVRRPLRHLLGVVAVSRPRPRCRASPTSNRTSAPGTSQGGLGAARRCPRRARRRRRRRRSGTGCDVAAITRAGGRAPPASRLARRRGDRGRRGRRRRRRPPPLPRPAPPPPGAPPCRGGARDRRRGSSCCSASRAGHRGLAHHNVSFSDDYRAEFAVAVRRRHPGRRTRPSTSAASSVTDPSQAPAGHENWFVLVNAPSFPTDHGSETDADLVEHAYRGYGDHVLEVMARRGWDLSRAHRPPGGDHAARHRSDVPDTRAGRSTARRRTARWPPSSARATEARSTGSTSAAAAATPAAGSPSWPSAAGSPPTSASTTSPTAR